jgi:uncharacterized protein DUF6064
MTLPFTITEFLRVFEGYNTAIWPLQVLAYLGGAAVVGLIVARSRHAGTVAATVLAAMWLLNGIGYHFLFFREINPAAMAFAALFVAQAALIAWFGLVARRLQFPLRLDAAAFVGALAVIYAMLVYPLLGWTFGHVYPTAPIFGVAPCPTTIFTLGILLLARPAAPAWLFVVPVIWSAIGGSAAVLLAVREDFGLIAAGIAAVLVLIFAGRGRGVRPGGALPA